MVKEEATNEFIIIMKSDEANDDLQQKETKQTCSHPFLKKVISRARTGNNFAGDDVMVFKTHEWKKNSTAHSALIQLLFLMCLRFFLNMLKLFFLLNCSAYDLLCKFLCMHTEKK